MFKIVKFLETDEVEMVNKIWMKETDEGKICYWPIKYKTEKLKRALLQGETPNDSWITYKVETLGSYGMYIFS